MDDSSLVLTYHRLLVGNSWMGVKWCSTFAGGSRSASGHAIVSKTGDPSFSRSGRILGSVIGGSETLYIGE
jgi:hypothetical protein